ncbi:MAG: TetR/AcrR family transcriptional regulator [Bacillota bacterium]|nr:TetR/AcrR family transcriptional regulator [Bacillota bacterium]
MSKGMSKGITKENIVDVTLRLIRDKDNIRSVNLREIARELGCAHTNLYNHFSDLDGILWDASYEVLLRSCDFILSGIDSIENSNSKLEVFYKRLIEFYLENRGWFRLFWLEKLHGEIPESNKRLTSEIVERYVDFLNILLEKLYNVKLDNGKTMYVFHTIDCYLHGEISKFISGRGLITEENQFREYILRECVKLTRLLTISIE